MNVADEPLAPVSCRLAHGWRLINLAGASREMVREFLRPAVRAVPSSMARRLGSCRISLLSGLDSDAGSKWIETEFGLDVRVAIPELEEHDVAMELLLCLGQVLWGRLFDREAAAYWLLLKREILDGIPGEIDEAALDEKRALLAGSAVSGRGERLERYGFASFAGTAAEYVHSLWHDVKVRIGPDHLPPSQLRLRLELLARWFPPNRGYRLFPAARSIRDPAPGPAR